MPQNAFKRGLRHYSDHDVRIAGDASGVIDDSRGTGLAIAYRRKPRSWNRSRTDLPIIHESAFQRRKVAANESGRKYWPWILEEQYDVEKWIPFDKRGQ